MSEQNNNNKYSAYNQEDNYILCPSGFKYYLGFTGRIPFHILIDDDLSGTDIKLYGIIEGLCYAFKGFNKNNYVANNDFCFLLGLSKDSTAFERSLKKLKEKNLVKREKKTVTEKGKTFKAWCWSIEFGNFYTLINDNKQQDPHQKWDTECDTPTSSGVPDPHQEWGQIADNKISENTTSVSSETPEVVTEVLEVYHEIMFDMPKVKHVTNKLSAAIKRLKKEWPDIKGVPLTSEALAKYFEGIRDLAPWMTKAYTTKSGYKKRNSLINLIRIDNIKSFYNGDYCAE